MSELAAPDFGRPVLNLRDELPNSRGLTVYVRSGFCPTRQKRVEFGCCEMQIIKGTLDFLTDATEVVQTTATAPTWSSDYLSPMVKLSISQPVPNSA